MVTFFSLSKMLIISKMLWQKNMHFWYPNKILKTVFKTWSECPKGLLSLEEHIAIIEASSQGNLLKILQKKLEFWCVKNIGNLTFTQTIQLTERSHNFFAWLLTMLVVREFRIVNVGGNPPKNKKSFFSSVEWDHKYCDRGAKHLHSLPKQMPIRKCQLVGIHLK